MASPIQTVVGKGISNPLTAGGLLKILRDLFPFDSLVSPREDETSPKFHYKLDTY